MSPLVAAEVGLKHLDTGLMYRAVSFQTLNAGIALDDHDAVGAVADEIQLKVLDGGVVEIEGEMYKSELRSPEVSQAVSVVSANVDVRNEMVKRQREWADQNGGGVVDGRDIGTAVFPEATLKIFLVADLEARAQRRVADTNQSIEAVMADIERRDIADSTREAMPLRKADDAIELDTTNLSIEEVVAEITKLFQQATSQ